MRATAATFAVIATIFVCPALRAGQQYGQQPAPSYRPPYPQNPVVSLREQQATRQEIVDLKRMVQELIAQKQQPVSDISSTEIEGINRRLDTLRDSQRESQKNLVNASQLRSEISREIKDAVDKETADRTAALAQVGEQIKNLPGQLQQQIEQKVQEFQNSQKTQLGALKKTQDDSMADIKKLQASTRVPLITNDSSAVSILIGLNFIGMGMFWYRQYRHRQKTKDETRNGRTPSSEPIGKELVLSEDLEMKNNLPYGPTEKQLVEYFEGNDLTEGPFWFVLQQEKEDHLLFARMRRATGPKRYILVDVPGHGPTTFGKVAPLLAPNPVT